MAQEPVATLTTPTESVAASTPLVASPSSTTPTTPGDTAASLSDQPQALDGSADAARQADRKSRRRAERAKLREAQADRTTDSAADPVPSVQATGTDLIDPSSLNVTAVPNFFIEDFDIPPFLLQIYQAAGSEYGVRWEVLAAINKIETNYGRNLNVSSAGALGWMQFMPATWATYGVDANDDGEKDPFNPADAIFAAARYLKAAGAGTDLRTAIFAYNHADWYVDQVMQGARAVSAYPDSLIDSLTGITQGVFPVSGADDKIDYPGRTAVADDESVAVNENAAKPVVSKKGRNSIEITSAAGSPVVAVQDGIVEKVGESKRLGKFVRLRDSYGNRYTYGHLGTVQAQVPVPKPTKADSAGHAHSDDESVAHDATPTTAATAGKQTDQATPTTDAPATTTPADATPATTPAPRVRLAANSQEESLATATPQEARKVRLRARAAVDNTTTKATKRAAAKERLYANPARPGAFVAGGDQQLNPSAAVVTDEPTTGAAVGELASYFSIDYGLDAGDVTLRDLKAGQAVIAGTVLGHTQAADPALGATTSKVTFEIRPAGKEAPRIDPRPILDGWRSLDATDFYNAQAKKAVAAGATADADADTATVGQVLLMSKAELQTRVLNDKRISIYECGRRDVKAGQIDRRVLALLEVLAVKGVNPTVTSMKCGHGTYTSSGNVSQHTTGTAVDIATAYGSVITPATQGVGSITDRAVREILELQGTMKPDQIITLMQYEGEDNTLAMADHDDHIHVGYKPITGENGAQLDQVLKSGQWGALVSQLSKLDVPDVAATPSQYSVTVKKSKK